MLIPPSQLPLPFISSRSYFQLSSRLKPLLRDGTDGRESEGKGNKSNRIQASGIFSQLERRTSPPAKQVGSARAEIRVDRPGARYRLTCNTVGRWWRSRLRQARSRLVSSPDRALSVASKSWRYRAGYLRLLQHAIASSAR